MPVRSLNGLDSSVRSLNGLSDRIDYTVSLPLTMNSDYNIKLSNLNSYGSANQILKMNSAGNALEFTNETDTVHTAQTPIVIINGVISLSTLNGLGSANQILKVNSAGNALEYSNQQDISNFITASSTTTFTNKSMSYSQISSRPFDIFYNNSLMIANYSSVFKQVSGRCIVFSNNSKKYRHSIKHLDTGLEFYLSVANNGITGTNLIFDISTAGLNLNVCDTVSSGHLLINSSGIIKKSVDSFTLPSSSGTLALTSDITNTTYTVALPLTLSAQNKIGLAGLTSYGNDNQILRMNGTGSIEWSNEQDISNFITASSTTTFTNKSMSYGQITSRPFEVSYSAGLLFANYLSIFKTVNNRCILFANSSSNYRHNIKHNDTNLEFYLSTTNDGFTGLNKKLTIGLTSIQPSVDISLLGVGNSTGISQIIKFNNDIYNTIGCDFNTEVANVGGMEIKGFAAIENIITRTDSSDNMRTILANNVFQVLKGNNPTVNKTLMLLRDGASNSLGDVSNDLLILGKDLFLIGNNIIFLGSLTQTGMYIVGSGVFFGNGTPVSSDDRIKFNETKITYNALETINKLVVVEYDKKYNKDLPETEYGVPVERHLLNDTPQKEYGFIAQDTWNNIPELRFTIKNVDTTIPENFDENGLLIEDCKVRTTNSEGEEFLDRKYLSVDYANINILNIRAVQELSEIVRQQQIIIDKLINSTSFKNFKDNI